MFKAYKSVLASVVCIGIPALAIGAGIQDVDANADGVLTIDEVQSTYPEITVDTFSAMDVNSDGALDEAEVAAAQEAGIMPISES